jgi:hypothetical protein
MLMCESYGPEYKGRHMEPDGPLDKLNRLGFQNLRSYYRLGEEICRAVDNEEGLDEVFLSMQKTTECHPLWQPACLSVLSRHRPLDDWNAKTMQEHVLQALKEEHHDHADEIPARVRQLLVAYEVALDEYRKRDSELLKLVEECQNRLSELFLMAYKVKCPSCGSADLEARQAVESTACFFCRSCETSFSERD